MLVEDSMRAMNNRGSRLQVDPSAHFVEDIRYTERIARALIRITLNRTTRHQQSASLAKHAKHTVHVAIVPIFDWKPRRIPTDDTKTWVHFRDRCNVMESVMSAIIPADVRTRWTTRVHRPQCKTSSGSMLSDYSLWHAESLSTTCNVFFPVANLHKVNRR